MAHLPRWIARLDVDSQAMLGAFTHWYGKASPVDRDETRWLYLVEHSMDPLHGFLGIESRFEDGHVIPSVPCSEPGCVRCTTGRGGYKFRWFDERWADAYNRSCRAGSAALQAQVRFKFWSDQLQLDCADRLGLIGSTVLSISVKSRQYSEIVRFHLYLYGFRSLYHPPWIGSAVLYVCFCRVRS